MSAIQTPGPSALVTDIFECLNDHDADRLRQLHADGIVEEWPIVGRMEGSGPVRDHFAAMFAAMPDFHIEVDRMAADGDTVFVQWHATGTFSGGPFEGIEATGRPIDLKGTNCMTVHDGKVVSDFTAYDGMTYAAQAGLLPRHGSALDHVVTFGANSMTRTRKLLSRLAEMAAEKMKEAKATSEKPTSEKATDTAEKLTTTATDTAEKLRTTATDTAEKLTAEKPKF